MPRQFPDSDKWNELVADGNPTKALKIDSGVNRLGRSPVALRCFRQLLALLIVFVAGSSLVHNRNAMWKIVITTAVLLLFTWTAVSTTQMLGRAHVWPLLSPDYTTLAASHALFWEAKGTAAEKPAAFFQCIHPGIPFQLVSWWIARWMYFDAALSFRDNAVALLSNLPDYRDALSYLALSLNCAAVVLGAWIASRLRNRSFLVSMAAFGAFSHAWIYSVMELGNDSFACVGVLLLSLIWRRAALSVSIPICILLGIFSGAMYLVKLNYLVLAAAGAVPILLAPNSSTSYLRRLGYVSSYGGSFLLTVLGGAGAALGPNGLREMVFRHRSVFLRTGYYGGGEAGVVNLRAAGQSAVELFREGELFVVLTVLLGAVGGAVALRQLLGAWNNRAHDSQEARGRAIFLLTCCAATAGFVLAGLKHYRPHYFIPLVPLLFLIAVALLHKASRKLEMVLGSVLVLAAVQGYSKFAAFRSGVVAENGVSQLELQQITSLPLAPGERRIWTYQSKSEISVLSQILLQAGHLDALHTFFPGKFTSDEFYDLWATAGSWSGGDAAPICVGNTVNPAIPWRYLVRLNREPHISHPSLACLSTKTPLIRGQVLYVVENVAASASE